jgi:SAM-dependent methyltransferase
MELWSYFKDKVSYLIHSKDSMSKKLLIWNELEALINSKNYIPPHYGSLFDFENKIINCNKSIKILDHGCGSGLSVIFLILKGYTNTWGVTVNFDKNRKKIIMINRINKFINLLLNNNNKNENRIQFYNGKTLPFEKNSFDFIFSQQVFEHLDINTKKSFIFSERLALKNNGLLYHQIPHRLVPYEAHTKNWFIHWLPLKIQKIFFRKKNYELNFIEKHLFLDWPWSVKAFFKDHSMSYENITYKRLRNINNNSELKGASLFIRKVIGFIFVLPFIGVLIIKLLAIFFMIEVFSYKFEKKI